jgi:hypothetical protein
VIHLFPIADHIPCISPRPLNLTLLSPSLSLRRLRLLADPLSLADPFSPTSLAVFSPSRSASAPPVTAGPHWDADAATCPPPADRTAFPLVRRRATRTATPVIASANSFVRRLLSPVSAPWPTSCVRIACPEPVLPSAHSIRECRIPATAGLVRPVRVPIRARRAAPPRARQAGPP